MDKRRFFLAITCALALATAGSARADYCINNGIDSDFVGHWSVCLWEGGYSEEGNLTARRYASDDIYNENVIYDWRTFIDLGSLGGDDIFALDDFSSDIYQETSNTVELDGSFDNANEANVSWHMSCTIEPGSPVMRCTLHLMTEATAGLGQIRVIQYLDEDVEGSSDDVFQPRGSATGGDLELLTVDNVEVYGVAQSGATTTGQGLVNATFAGWAADEYDEIQDRLEAGTAQSVSPSGVIMNLEPYSHPVIGPTHGPADIVTAMAWDVAPSSSSATIIFTLGGIVEAPPPVNDCVPGDIWPESGDGVVDLRDFCAAWRAVLHQEELGDRARACSDVYPGFEVCRSPSGMPGRTTWCPQGDERVSLGDVIIVFRTLLRTLTLGCEGCGPHHEDRVAAGLQQLPGDLVPDDRVDIADVVRALRLSVGATEMTAEDLVRGDVAPFTLDDAGLATVTGDGIVGIADVVALLRTAVGAQGMQWPLRNVDVVLTGDQPDAGRMVGVAGWPAWAQPGSIFGSACLGMSDAADGTWGWACTEAGAAGAETVTFTYRSGRPVDVGTLQIDARAVTDTGVQVPLGAAFRR